MKEPFRLDVCVVGGGGHVGLPLALTMADVGLRTVIYDTDRDVLEMIGSGRMPFLEVGGQETLERVLASGRLELTHEPALVRDCESIVMIIGTPVDEHLNPDIQSIVRAIGQCMPHLRDGQLLVLRSTVFPGTTAHLQRLLEREGLAIDVVFCPERVLQGQSLTELRTTPQIVSGFSPAAADRARALFSHFCRKLIEMQPLEAELCKLMTNAWRYIQFATVNQFYMVATQNGADFERILHGCRYDYPRMASMPGPGLTAGPCLVKDTMQLAAFSQNQFVLGHAAMLINEGMPRHLLECAKRRIDLSKATAGILGMAFKAESDDRRDSLSYKLRKLLLVEAARVLCTDPFVRDPSLVPLDRVVAESEVLFVGAPHSLYRSLEIPPSTVVIDVWNHLGGAPGAA